MKVPVVRPQNVSASASAERSRPTVLAVHPFLGNGGSECAAAWALQGLAGDFDVTFCTASDFDVSRLNRDYGTNLEPSQIRFLKAPMAKVPGGQYRLVGLQHAVFDRFCRQAAPGFDACLSLYNFVDFGRPAIQRIADFSFDEQILAEVNPAAAERLAGGAVFRNAYHAVCNQVRGRRSIHTTNASDFVIVNSQWTGRLLRERLGRSAHAVVFPPVPPLPVVPGDRDPTKFVMVGRVSPEKRIEEAIEVFAAVREAGYSVSLSIAGYIPDEAYGHSIRTIADRHPWVKLSGHLDMTSRAALFAGATYGFHACLGEAFGIAVAEMMASGLTVFVPQSGGVAELAPDKGLVYSNRREAVSKVCSLLKDERERSRIGLATADRAQEFSTENYMARMRSLVGSAVGELRPTLELAR